MLSPSGDGGSDHPLDPATTQIIRCRATLSAKVTDVKLHNVQDDTLTSPQLLIKNSSTSTANHSGGCFSQLLHPRLLCRRKELLWRRSKDACASLFKALTSCFSLGLQPKCFRDAARSLFQVIRESEGQSQKKLRPTRGFRVTPESKLTSKQL